jgi:hypothetical protein
VIGCEAKFVKRALGLTTFRCSQGLELAEKVANTCKTFEAEEYEALTIGYNEAGEVVSEFKFKWGIKARKKEARERQKKEQKQEQIKFAPSNFIPRRDPAAAWF